MKLRLKASPVPMVIPIGAENFTGVVDLLKMKQSSGMKPQGMKFDYRESS
jgi:elongation factor G